MIRRPNREAILDTLISPLIRQRTLVYAPDPAFALGAIADRYDKTDPSILQDALDRLISERNGAVKPKDISNAIDKAISVDKAKRAMEWRSRRDARFEEIKNIAWNRSTPRDTFIELRREVDDWHRTFFEHHDEGAYDYEAARMIELINQHMPATGEPTSG